MRLVAGERVALLIGCTPPSGWSVALRRSEVARGTTLTLTPTLTLNPKPEPEAEP